MGPVRERLLQLCTLPQGWNGYDAGSVDVAVANHTLRILEQICGPDTPTPSIVPGINGDVQIEWHLDDIDIELHVRAPNDVHAWREISGVHARVEDVLITDDVCVLLGWIEELKEMKGAAVATAA